MMSERPRILLVEDEKSLQDSLTLNLEMEDYEVVVAQDGRQALDKFQSQGFDLVILDVMLPEIDGFQVCERIRLDDSITPILFLTAKSTAEDRVKGLKKGGDDYLVKPFNLEELLLRVKNLLRHHQRAKGHQQVGTTYKFGNNKIDFRTFTAQTPQDTYELSEKEMKLLKLLIEKENEVVSREEILEAVWGYDIYPTTRTIDNYIVTFRKYFEDDPKNPRYFQSVRGVGYKFVPEND